MNYKAVIIIPIYKEKLTMNEEASLRRCFQVLGNHPISFVTHTQLNVDIYNSIANEYNLYPLIRCFDKQYFNNIQGYNRLCLSNEFYDRFCQYEYMLIYQLDAWVFEDQLIEWCNKGYDYIGAPWFTNYGTYEQGEKLWAVGNGGLSLRRIAYYLKIFSWKFPLMRPHWRKLANVHYIAYYLGRHNTIGYFQQHIITNEDFFLSHNLLDSWLPPRIPECNEALFFAFEKSPSYLFERANRKLPFGCHAYLKNEFETFWIHHIQ